MRAFLVDIGGLFLLLTGPAMAVAFVRGARKGTFEPDDLIRAIGIFGFGIWCLVGLAGVAWLAALPFGGVMWLGEQLTSRLHVSPILILLAPLVAIGCVGAVDRRRRMRIGTGREPNGSLPPA